MFYILGFITGIFYITPLLIGLEALNKVEGTFYEKALIMFVLLIPIYNILITADMELHTWK